MTGAVPVLMLDNVTPKADLPKTGALTMVDFPVALQVGSEYALAVIKGASPAAMMLALHILSPVGQKTLLDYGFKPVGLPSN